MNNVFPTLSSSLDSLEALRLDPSYFQITSDWFIGFVEAEGHFCGSDAQAVFSFTQHPSDFTLMEAITEFLGHGKVGIIERSNGTLLSQVQIYDRDVLRNVIIPMFDGGLHTFKKSVQFVSWVEKYFPDVSTVQSLVPLQDVTAGWLTGFTDGDGSFHALIREAKDYACGYQVQLNFDLTQVITETPLLAAIGAAYFSNKHTWGQSGNIQHLEISGIQKIVNYVVPFYMANPLLTRKQFDFLIWLEMVRMVKAKEHLKLEGVNKVRELRELQHHYRKNISPRVLKKFADRKNK